MAIFEENRLRPEEISGGFDSESTEDTFLLERLDEYPGELPDMFDISEQLEETLNAEEPVAPTEAAQAVELQEEAIAEEPVAAASEYLFEDAAEPESEGTSPIEPEQTEAVSIEAASEPEDADSVWDVFNQEQPAFDTSKEQIDFADLAEGPASDRIANEQDDLISAPTEQPEKETLTSGPTEQPEIEDDVFSSAADLIDPELLMSEPAQNKPAAAQPISDDELDIDTAGITFEDSRKDDEPISNADILGDDLKSLIEQDLERAKSRKPRAADEPAKELSDDEIRDKLSEFKAVDDSDPDVLIDLTAIQTEHPSTVMAGAADATADEINLFGESEAKQPAKKEKKQKVAAAAVPEPAADENPEPKKPRKPLPWKSIGLSAAILLIAGAIGFGVYYTFTETTIIADLGDGISKLFASDSGKAPDSTAAKEQEKAEPSATTDEPATAEKHKATPEKVEAKTEETKPTKKPEVAETPIHEEKPQEPQKLQKKEPVAEQKITEAKPARKHDASKKKTTDKIKDIAQIKKEAKEAKKQIPAKTKHQAAKPESRDAVYTIEVYSSPSRDDAEEWVRLLGRRKVQKVFIKEQKIRDVVWYKVRFGQFQSKEEAKKTAENHGFSHIWIDRVK